MTKKKKEGISHHLSLNHDACSDAFFESKIKSVICGLRDLKYEHLVVGEVSESIDFIQTYVRSDGTYRLEVQYDKEHLMFVIGFTREQTIQIFYDACVNKKSFDALPNYGRQWQNYWEREAVIEQVVDDFSDKTLTADEEAMYIEALQSLYFEYGHAYAQKGLAEYYEKKGDVELARKYQELAAKEG